MPQFVFKKVKQYLKIFKFRCFKLKPNRTLCFVSLISFFIFFEFGIRYISSIFQKKEFNNISSSIVSSLKLLNRNNADVHVNSLRAFLLYLSSNERNCCNDNCIAKIADTLGVTSATLKNKNGEELAHYSFYDKRPTIRTDKLCKNGLGIKEKDFMGSNVVLAFSVPDIFSSCFNKKESVIVVGDVPGKEKISLSISLNNDLCKEGIESIFFSSDNIKKVTIFNNDLIKNIKINSNQNALGVLEFEKDKDGSKIKYINSDLQDLVGKNRNEGILFYSRFPGYALNGSLYSKLNRKDGFLIENQGIVYRFEMIFSNHRILWTFLHLRLMFFALLIVLIYIPLFAPFLNLQMQIRNYRKREVFLLDIMKLTNINFTKIADLFQAVVNKVTKILPKKQSHRELNEDINNIQECFTDMNSEMFRIANIRVENILSNNFNSLSINGKCFVHKEIKIAIDAIQSALKISDNQIIINQKYISSVFANINSAQYRVSLFFIIKNTIEVLYKSISRIKVECSIQEDDNFAICKILYRKTDYLIDGNKFDNINFDSNMVGSASSKFYILSAGGEIDVNIGREPLSVMQIIKVPRLDQIDMPSWFMDEMLVDLDSNICIFNEKENIFDLWSLKFKDVDDDFEDRIDYISNMSDFKNYALKNKDKKVLYIIDHHFTSLKDSITGLELIKKMGIQSKSILISDSCEDLDIGFLCEKHGIKFLPYAMIDDLSIKPLDD